MTPVLDSCDTRLPLESFDREEGGINFTTVKFLLAGEKEKIEA